MNRFKKVFKIVCTIVAVLLIVIGFVGYLLTSIIALHNYQGNKIKPPSDPMSFLYFFVLLVGVCIILFLYHKQIFGFFRSIAPDDKKK